MLKIIQKIIIFVRKISNEVPFIEIKKHYDYLHKKTHLNTYRIILSYILGKRFLLEKFK